MRADRARKSVGAENTFATDLRDYEPMCEALQPILEKVWRHGEATGAGGRTVTLKVKYADFEQVTKSRLDMGAIDSDAALERVTASRWQRRRSVDGLASDGWSKLDTSKNPFL